MSLREQLLKEGHSEGELGFPVALLVLQKGDEVYYNPENPLNSFGGKEIGWYKLSKTPNEDDKDGHRRVMLTVEGFPDSLGYVYFSRYRLRQ